MSTLLSLAWPSNIGVEGSGLPHVDSKRYDAPGENTSWGGASLCRGLDCEESDRGPEHNLRSINDHISLKAGPLTECSHMFRQKLISEKGNGFGSLFICVSRWRTRDRALRLTMAKDMESALNLMPPLRPMRTQERTKTATRSVASAIWIKVVDLGPKKECILNCPKGI